MRPATTYSPNTEMGVSTIGPYRLNFRVRNGNGCSPVGNITGLIRLSNKTLGGSLVLAPIVWFRDQVVATARNELTFQGNYSSKFTRIQQASSQTIEEYGQ